MKFLLKIIFVFISFTCIAQIPEAPELCLVTVGEQDSLVQLRWQHSDTSKINGFIIKRKIFNGNGVVEGSLNNIEFLSNTTTSYTDTSTDYSTFANPYIRAEEYTVNAYVIRNDSTIFSQMAPVQNTIFLTTHWDICSANCTFSWNKYKNREVKNYILLYSKNKIDFDTLVKLSPETTTFSTKDLDSNCFYYFKLKSILEQTTVCKSDTSTSNLTEMFSYVPNISKDILINNVSVFENSYIRVNFSHNDLTGIKNYKLLRDNIEIATFDKNNLPAFLDDYCEVDKLHKYYFAAIDSCENQQKSSDTVQNIVLSATINDKEFYLSWNATTINKKDIFFYELFVEYDNKIRQIKTFDNNIFEANISLRDIFDTEINNQIDKIKFKIVANGQNSLKSASNTAIVELTGILSIPNAFNPNSQNKKNRFFSIQTAFVKDFSIIITTQNGTIVYSSSDAQNSWNGRNKQGQLMPQDAYIYHINYISNSGKTNKKTGVVNLVY